MFCKETVARSRKSKHSRKALSVTLFSIILSFSLFGMSGNAATKTSKNAGAKETLTKTATFESEKKGNFDNPLDQEIKKGNKTFALKETNYKITKTAYKEKDSFTKKLEEPQKTCEKDNKTYKLKSSKEISKKVQKTSSKKKFPKKYKGLTLQSVETKQSDDAQFYTLTFEGSDKWAYQWNGYEIEADADGPVLSKKAREALEKELGGEITSVTWLSDDGDTRTAQCVVNGKKSYVATYGKNCYECVYTYRGEPVYTVEATGLYELKETAKTKDNKSSNKSNQSPKSDQATKNNRVAKVITGIIIASILVIIDIILIRKLLKKKKNREVKK